jgi:hypothetical protein
MDKCNIIDNRKSFTRLSFSNHKKNKVIEELISCIFYKKRDDALHWTAEMICSTYILDLWKIYIIFYCKYIHIHNIKIAIYLLKKLEDFKIINKSIKNDKDIKNNDNIRNIFFTITIILCESKNENTLSTIPFVFSLEHMYDNLKANNVEYIKPFFKEGDPKEYYIPLNEFVYHIDKTKDQTTIFYWIDWLIEYDIYLIKKKKPIYIQYRNLVDFKDEKKNKNIIWLLWDIIIHFSKQHNDLEKKTILSLFQLFQIKYKLTNNKTYKSLLYVSINLILSSNINTNVKLIENTSLFKNLYDNTQIIFEEIKKKEVWIEEVKTEKQKLYDSVYKI